MVDNKYAAAYTEVLEILKHIPIEDYNKIPKNEIELLEAYADNNYTFNYDTSKTLEEQNVSDITKAIIILLFRDYWATEIQRKKIIAKQNYDRMKLEEKKKEKYNAHIFQDRNNDKQKINIEDTKEIILVEYKESIFKRIINKIKTIFDKQKEA